MTDESIQARFHARVVDEKTKRDVFFKVQTLVMEVAKALHENAVSFSFENCTAPTTHRFPAKITADARKWPTADQIQAALNHWLKAREDLFWLWDRMTPHERIGFAVPAGYPGQSAAA